jgi:hypothetical protein
MQDRFELVSASLAKSDFGVSSKSSGTSRAILRLPKMLCVDALLRQASNTRVYLFLKPSCL